MARGEEHPRPGRELRHHARRLGRGHPRHHDVAQDQRGSAAGAEQLDGLRAARGLEHLVAVLGERARRDLPHRGLVLHHQHQLAQIEA
jgi:hypothetical protein